MAETESKSVSAGMSADESYPDGWGFAHKLRAEIQEDRESLLVAASTWVSFCEFIRWQERRLLILPENPDPADLAAHKKCLEIAVKVGKRLLAVLDHSGTELPAPFGRQELGNALRKSEFDLEMRHNRPKVSQEERAAVLKAAFGE